MFLLRRTIKFLGWIISNGTITPDQEKVSALRNWVIPDPKQEVQSFTGFCNFYKRLIPGYSKLMAPLHDLQRDEIPNSVEAFKKQGCWTPLHTTAFRKVIVTMTEAPVVQIARPDLPYVLETDASEVAVGGILSQVDPATRQKFVVEYYSRRLSASQRYYEPYKLELLALIVCLQHWRHYLFGAPGGITIITDHEPLLAIKTTKNPSRVFLRWAHFIQQFSFKVQYIPGKDNPPDLLSRPPDRMNVGEKGITVGELDSDPDDASPTLNVLSCHSLWATLATLRPTLRMDSPHTCLAVCVRPLHVTHCSKPSWLVHTSSADVSKSATV